MKGFISIEIPGLVKDVLDIMGNRGLCTITTLEQKLEDLAWGTGIMDYARYKLINRWLKVMYHEDSNFNLGRQDLTGSRYGI